MVLALIRVKLTPVMCSAGTQMCGVCINRCGVDTNRHGAGASVNVLALRENGQCPLGTDLLVQRPESRHRCRRCFPRPRGPGHGAGDRSPRPASPRSLLLLSATHEISPPPFSGDVHPYSCLQHTSSPLLSGRDHSADVHSYPCLQHTTLRY